MAITREEQYLAFLNGEDVPVPEPVTRREQYLYNLCVNGVDNAGVSEAVSEYLEENGVAIEMDSNGIVRLKGE